MACGGKEVRYPFMDGVIHPAGGTAEGAFENLLLVLLVNMEGQISLADGAAEDIHQGSFHARSSRISMICVTSGPVDMRVIGQPISSSAVFRKSFAFLVSFW